MTLLSHIKFVQHTATTITSAESLRDELAKVRELGYAFDDEELDLGVRCIAAPIRDYTRRIVGAISISGPTMRVSNERIEKRIDPPGSQIRRRIVHPARLSQIIPT